jgi:NitT/TauT family transport system substrate-binding protein
MQWLMKRAWRLGAVAALALAVAAPVAAEAAEGKIHVALGDVPSIETLNLLIAIERAKERGIEIQLTPFKSEDVAAQAVVGGQADVGVGTPYAMMQKVKAPIRLFYQMSNLRFFPVVDASAYKDWKDLNGQEIAVQGRGSGTEAVMKMMAKRNGIEYGSISYVPGSEVRAGAMLQGNIKATVVDAANRRLLEEKAPGKFAVLPMENIDATDEALFANTEFLESEQEAVTVLVEELLKTWREINANPAVAAELRKKYNLLPDLPADEEEEIVAYFTESAESKAFPEDGGNPDAVKADFEFYTVSGQLEGDPASLKVEDFWTFEVVEAARKNLGQ